MSSPENIGEQALEQHVPLIDGLPNDLAILCLSRVPRRFRHILRCISRGWRALLCSEEFQACRHRQNLRETWIYALCANKDRINSCYALDPYSSRHWMLLQPIPSKCLKREGMAFEAIGNQLFLLGGYTCQTDASTEVYCYDTLTEKWEEVARMPTARCYFTSAALDDKIYVTDGFGVSPAASTNWDVYDIHSDSWSSFKDTSLIPGIVNSFVFKGKVYAIDMQNARVYDPLRRNWKDASQEMSMCAGRPTVVIQDKIYMLDESFGTKLLMWRNETEEWAPLGRPAQMLTKPPCQLVDVGGFIFIIGQQLYTVVVDPEKAGQLKRVLVGSSFGPIHYNHPSVLVCKTITL